MLGAWPWKSTVNKRYVVFVLDPETKTIKSLNLQGVFSSNNWYDSLIRKAQNDNIPPCELRGFGDRDIQKQPCPFT